jgi:nucleoside-diphosphate-sugar epimerase
MRVLLIGGNGFIGSPLAEQLFSSRHEVAIFHRGHSAAGRARDVHHIQGDRNQLSSYLDRLREFRPDVIVDLILSSGEQARELMKVASEIAARVVALSSMDVYRAWGVLHGVEPGELEPLPLTEDSRLRTTRKLYSAENLTMMQSIFTWVNEAYDKIAVEGAVMNSTGASGTVLRLPMVYGPGDPLHRFFPILKRIADGRPSIILPEDFASWRGPRGYVENVAHAIALAATADRAAGRVYNICEEPCLSELEWQTRIAKQTNWPGEIVVLPRSRTPKHLLFPGNAAQHVIASSDRIRTELGYEEIIDLVEAMQRTIAWEQTNPPTTINPQQFDYAAEDAALANAA